MPGDGAEQKQCDATTSAGRSPLCQRCVLLRCSWRRHLSLHHASRTCIDQIRGAPLTSTPRIGAPRRRGPTKRGDKATATTDDASRTASGRPFCPAVRGSVISSCSNSAGLRRRPSPICRRSDYIGGSDGNASGQGSTRHLPILGKTSQLKHPLRQSPHWCFLFPFRLIIMPHSEGLVKRATDIFFWCPAAHDAGCRRQRGKRPRSRSGGSELRGRRCGLM